MLFELAVYSLLQWVHALNVSSPSPSHRPTIGPPTELSLPKPVRVSSLPNLCFEQPFVEVTGAALTSGSDGSRGSRPRTTTSDLVVMQKTEDRDDLKGSSWVGFV